MSPYTMRQTADDGQLNASQTAAAVQKSRAFLEQRLAPDLERAKDREATLAKDKSRFQSLHVDLTKWKEQRQTVSDSHTLVASLGRGIHVPVQVATSSLVIVSMGLSTASETAWSASADTSHAPSPSESADAGLYAELTVDEALVFTQRKVSILNTKLQRARERSALIEGHIELTSKSIEQLELLHRDPSASFLDYLA